MFKFSFFIKFSIILLVSKIAYSKEAEQVGMPQMSIPDYMPQLVWLLIIFPIIYLTMKYIALPRISEIITNREHKIAGDLAKAEEIKNKIEQTNKDHQLAIEETNKKIKEIINEINNNTLKEADKRLQECQSEINQELEKEKSKLKKEINDFNQNLNSISSEIVENIITKLYNEKPDPKIIKDKVNIYIESYKHE